MPDRLDRPVQVSGVSVPCRHPSPAPSSSSKASSTVAANSGNSVTVATHRVISLQGRRHRPAPLLPDIGAVPHEAPQREPERDGVRDTIDHAELRQVGIVELVDA
jgi:hypothetical protein